MNEHAVRADAGLAHVAILRGDGAFHGKVKVRVIEDYERRVAAQFHAHLLHSIGALAHQDLADFGRTGERHLAHVRRFHHRADNGGRIARQHVEHAGRHARAFGEVGQRERAQRGFFRRFDDHRAAHREGRGRLARDHGDREVPRRNGRDHAHGLLQHDDPRVGAVARDHIAIRAAAFLGEPAQEIGAVDDFALGFRQRLALLGRHEFGQIILLLKHQLVPTHENVGPLEGGFLRPGLERLCGRGDGALGLGRADIGHLRDFGARGGVGDGNRLPAIGPDPLTADIIEGLGLSDIAIAHGEYPLRGGSLFNGAGSEPVQGSYAAARCENLSSPGPCEDPFAAAARRQAQRARACLPAV